MNHPTPLEQAVKDQLERYFQDLGTSQPQAVLAMVNHCVERAVLQVILERAQGNQTVAAKMLGLSRGTLRKKLQLHQISI